MKRHYQRLFAYDAWATSRIISAITKLSTPDDRCLLLLSHLAAAQEIWLGRITGDISSITPFAERTLAESSEAFQHLSKRWTDFLNDSPEEIFSKQIIYKNLKGEQFANAAADILTHVINHSTYHRGQIVSALKGKIEKLPVTDFIAFARE